MDDDEVKKDKQIVGNKALESSQLFKTQSRKVNQMSKLARIEPVLLKF